MPTLQWQSADKRVRKEIIKRGKASETPLDGSRVYLTIENCIINGTTEIDAKQEWHSEILNGEKKKIIIIGESFSVLDRQIEKGLQMMTVKEKSLITVLHASDPNDFLIGTAATIKVVVTLNKMDLHTTGLQWQSADKRVRKEVIKCGESPKTPLQGSTVYLTIEHCIVNGISDIDSGLHWNSKILGGDMKRSLIIGESFAMLDQQIEMALKTMTVKEKSLITVLHEIDTLPRATIRFEVTLNKIDLNNSVLHWQSADQRVQKDVVTRGKSFETPVDASRVYLTIENCIINGTTKINAKQEWNSEILDDVTNKILIIGESTCVLDQQIEKALQTMTVGEKSLITIQHASNPNNPLIGAPATIKFEVTLNKMDLHTTGLQWQSPDKKVRKDVIKYGESLKTPSEGSTVYLTIEYCTVNGVPERSYIGLHWKSKILDDDTKKSFIVGNSSCVLDEQIEKALKTMTVKEKSLITVLHASDPIGILIGAPAAIQLVVTLNKIDGPNTVLPCQLMDKKVKKEIIKRGESTETPSKGSRVYLSIGICYINGTTEIDAKQEWNSEILDDVTNKILIIGESSCVLDQQIEEALQTMTVKEKSLITVLQDFRNGAPASIKFEVTLDMMDLQTTDLKWQSADQRARKEIIKCGESTKTPSQGSTVHFTIEHCIINGTTNIDAKQQWNSKILDGGTKKSFIIGNSSCVLDKQIEMVLKTMTVKEKSLITVLHGSDPIDFIIGAPATIKFVVTLNKIDGSNTVLSRQSANGKAKKEIIKRGEFCETPLKGSRILFWQSADGKVRKEIIKHGKCSKRPAEGSTVYLTIENSNYSVNEMTLIEATELANSEILDGGTKKTFIIGESSCVIDRQIERALQMMAVKEKSSIYIRNIITFQVTLNKRDLHKRIWEWTPEEKYDVALKNKEKGVRLYKDKRDKDAFLTFSRACKILITMEPIVDLGLEENLKEKIKNLRLILYNNMASCQLNCHNFEHAVTLCNKVLEKDEKNVKALYRRGVAYGTLHDVEHAIADLKRVLTLEPENSAAKARYMKYNAKVREANLKSVDMVKKMFKS